MLLAIKHEIRFFCALLEDLTRLHEVPTVWIASGITLASDPKRAQIADPQLSHVKAQPIYTSLGSIPFWFNLVFSFVNGVKLVNQTSPVEISNTLSLF